MIEEITAFEFTYTPWDNKFPIKQAVLTIVAKDRKEAELIALENDHKFFDQDNHVRVKEILQGYRQLNK
jgi:hypothetical protein